MPEMEAVAQTHNVWMWTEARVKLMEDLYGVALFIHFLNYVKHMVYRRANISHIQP